MMQRRQLIQAMAAAASALAIPLLQAQTKTPVEVWKDPECGCCKDWVAHLQANGFEVRVHDSGNTAARTRLGIPQSWAPATPLKSARKESAMHWKATCRPVISGAC
jgi:hypothetical protein